MSEAEDLRVSNPEHFYDSLTQPKTDDPSRVYEELAAALDVPILSDDLLSKHRTWERISTAITMHESATKATRPRPDLEIGNRILGLMIKHPWLTSVRTSGPRNEFHITAEEFCAWSANHVFDDCPGLFGISEREGWTLRGRAQMVFYDRANIDREFIEALELPRPLTLDGN